MRRLFALSRFVLAFVGERCARRDGHDAEERCKYREFHEASFARRKQTSYEVILNRAFMTPNAAVESLVGRHAGTRQHHARASPCAGFRNAGQRP